jgi:uncharacterized YccA/Bax inhibitor family protein
MALRSSNPVLSRTFQNEVDYNQVGSNTPMTMEGATSKTLGAVSVVALTAAISWFTGLGAAFWFPAMLLGLGLGMWQAFTKKINPAAILTYAAIQGFFIGGISSIFESQYPGIVQNAVLATLTTAVGMFFAYRMGWIKVTSRFKQIMTVALFGYLGFSLINLGFAVFAGSSAYSTGFGWLIALFGVGLAALTLSLDFDYIEYGVKEKLPAEFEWRAAFGLTASLVWLYVEILRLLSIFNRD